MIAFFKTVTIPCNLQQQRKVEEKNSNSHTYTKWKLKKVEVTWAYNTFFLCSISSLVLHQLMMATRNESPNDFPKNRKSNSYYCCNYDYKTAYKPCVCVYCFILPTIRKPKVSAWIQYFEDHRFVCIVYAFIHFVHDNKIEVWTRGKTEWN